MHSSAGQTSKIAYMRDLRSKDAYIRTGCYAAAILSRRVLCTYVHIKTPLVAPVMFLHTVSSFFQIR